MTEPPRDPLVPRLLEECERALAARDWAQLDTLARQILAVEPVNGAALGFRTLAARGLMPPLPSLDRTPAAGDAAPLGGDATPPVSDTALPVSDAVPPYADAVISADDTAPPVPPAALPPPRPAGLRPAFAPPPRIGGSIDPPSASAARGAGPSEADRVEIEAMMSRAAEARAERDWRAARRYAREALVLDPELEVAAALAVEADQVLTAESLAAMQAAAEATEQRLRESRRGRFALPRLGLPRLSLPRLGRTRGSRRRGLLLPIVGAAALFVLTGLIAFAAFGQLNDAGSDGPIGLVANAAGGSGGNAGASDPTAEVAGDAVEAPTIEAVGCLQLEDGVTLECRPTLSGSADSYAWAATGGDPASGDDAVFRTVLPAGGPHRIALQVCTSGACSSAESQAFVVFPQATATATAAPTASDDPGPTTTALAGPPPPAAPTVGSIICNPNPAAVGERVTCSGRFGGGAVATYDWSVNGILIANSATLAGAYNTGGTRTIDLQVCNAGGCDTGSASLVVQQPATSNAPVINLIGCSPTAVQTGTAVNCAPTIDGEVDSYAWTSGATSRSGSTFFITYASAGTRTIALEVCNDDGCDTAEASIVVSELPPDIPLPPAISVSCSPNPVTVGVTTDCTVQNSGGGITSWVWSGGTAGSGSGPSYSTSFASTGSATVSLFASNTGGDDRDSASITVNPEAPSGLTINCTSPITAGGSTSCSVTGSSGGPIATHAWSSGGTAPSSTGATYSPSFATAGSYTVTLVASNAGGSASPAQTSVTVQVPLAAPVISIICGPNPVGEGVSTSCTVSNSGGAIAMYAWSDSDGGVGVGSSYSPTFATAGSYSVSLTATNATDSDTAGTTVTVQAPLAAPVISITCGPSPVDEGVSTSCTVSNSGGAIATYAWSDSDGGVGAGSSYSPTFATAGSYSVSLTATNATDSDTAGTTVTVEVASTPTP